MGRRGRARGFTSAVLRERARGRSAAEERAHAVAARVYSVALDIDGEAAYPLALQAPVQAAAELAAARIVEERFPDAEGEEAEELVGAVVTYLLAGFFSMALDYDPEHHARFRAEVERGERDDGEDGDGDPVGEAAGSPAGGGVREDSPPGVMDGAGPRGEGDERGGG